MMWWVLVAVVHAAEPRMICPDDPAGAIVRAAEDVEAAWLHLDASGFDLARNRLGKLQMCVDTPLEVADALALHRARALIAYVDGDVEAARRAYAAVHALQPDWSLPARLIPREHPLWRIYESAVDDDESEREIGFKFAPEHGWIVDGTVYPQPGDPLDEAGRPVLEYGLPADRAFVLQVFDLDRSVTYTGYHFSTADIPVQDFVLLPDPSEVRRKRRRDARIAGTVIGGSMVAAAAVTFGLGMTERQRITGGTASVHDVDEIQLKANTLGGVSYGVGGAGALLVTLVWAVPF